MTKRSNSILNFSLLIWLLVGHNHSFGHNEISTSVSFRLDKLTTLLLTNLPLICPFKANASLPSSFKWLSEWLQPANFVYPKLPYH